MSSWSGNTWDIIPAVKNLGTMACPSFNSTPAGFSSTSFAPEYEDLIYNKFNVH